MRARLVFYGFLLMALFAAAGWVKPYLDGPDIRIFKVREIKPVPVPVETVKWLTKVHRVRVKVPVEVIREVTPKQAEKLAEMKIALPELHARGKELVDVLGVPKAPYGGEMALTVDTTSGRIDGTFLAKPVPRIEFGGIREAGLEIDPVNTAMTAYYRQEFVRVGRVVVNGRVFATGSTKLSRSSVGIALGAAVRF